MSEMAPDRSTPPDKGAVRDQEDRWLRSDDKDRCPFCTRIQQGDFTQTSVTQVVRFEPLNPIVPGHMLFVSDVHYPDATFDPRVTAAVFGRAAEYGKGRGDFNLITSIGPAATQTIKHLHVHFVPRQEGDGLHLPWTGQVKS